MCVAYNAMARLTRSLKTCTLVFNTSEKRTLLSICGLTLFASIKTTSKSDRCRYPACSRSSRKQAPCSCGSAKTINEHAPPCVSCKEEIFWRPRSWRETKGLLYSVAPLLERPWFSRVWVKQEIWAARDASVLCGHERIPWDSFESLHRRLSGKILNDGDGNVEAATVEYRSRLINLLSSLRRASGDDLVPRPRYPMQNLSLDECEKLDIVNVSRRSAGSSCSDPRDHVYGLLGMSATSYQHKTAGFGKPLSKSNNIRTVDYAMSVPRVFADLTWYIMFRDKWFNALYLYAKYGEIINGTPLSSWVQDWRFNYSTSTLLKYPRDFIDAHNTSYTPMSMLGLEHDMYSTTALTLELRGM